MDQDTNLEIEERFPMIKWEPKQADDDIFLLLIYTPGIVPKKVPNSKEYHEAKNGSADVSFFNEGMDVVVTVMDDKKKKKTIYNFKVVRFPSPIIVDKSHWSVEKGQIFISLKKKEPIIKWYPIVSRRGLDQSSSSNSSSSEEEATGAAAPRPKRGVLRLEDLEAGTKRLVIIERKANESDPRSDDF